MGVSARHDVARPSDRSCALRGLAVFSRKQPGDGRFAVAVSDSWVVSFEGAECGFRGLDQLSIPVIEPPKGKRQERQQQAQQLDKQGESEKMSIGR